MAIMNNELEPTFEDERREALDYVVKMLPPWRQKFHEIFLELFYGERQVADVSEELGVSKSCIYKNCLHHLKCLRHREVTMHLADFYFGKNPSCLCVGNPEENNKKP